MNVLLGVSGPKAPFSALEATLERLLVAGDTLSVAVYAADDEAETEAVEREIREHFGGLEVEVDVRRLEGDSGASLADLAEREFDHLVMPGGSISPTGKIKLDSVHEFVLLNAQLPVTLVR